MAGEDASGLTFYPSGDYCRFAEVREMRAVKIGKGEVN